MHVAEANQRCASRRRTNQLAQFCSKHLHYSPIRSYRYMVAMYPLPYKNVPKVPHGKNLGENTVLAFSTKCTKRSPRFSRVRYSGSGYIWVGKSPYPAINDYVSWAGIQTRTQGTIFVNGERDELSKHRPLVTRVPQEDTMLRMLTVEEVVTHRCACVLKANCPRVTTAPPSVWLTTIRRPAYVF
jgi:hypothetical protein